MMLLKASEPVCPPTRSRGAGSFPALLLQLRTGALRCFLKYHDGREEGCLPFQACACAFQSKDLAAGD